MSTRTLVTMLTAFGVAAVLILQMFGGAKLRQENSALSEQVARLNQRLAETEQKRQTRPVDSPALSDGERGELLRLRGEVGVLKQQLAEAQRSALAAKAAMAKQLAAATPQSPTDSVEEQRQKSYTRLNYQRAWLLAFTAYAEQHDGQCPTSFAQAAPWLPAQANAQNGLTSDSFEIVYHGPLTNVPNAENVLVIREKEGWQNPDGTWGRSYGFADGHSEVPRISDGNFAAWEQRRLAQRSSP